MALRAEDVDLDRDRDLVERYQRGDPEAFDLLYRRHFDRLAAYCHRRVGDRHEAEELAQEAFVRALRAMPSFAGERRFYPWVTVIAQRLCIDHHRRQAKVEPADVIDLGSVEPDHAALFDAVDHDHVRRALDRVAPRHREVLDLREQEGMSYIDIADHLEVPVTTVEALLHRARKALRREFQTLAGSHRGWLLPGLGGLSSRVSALRARLGDRTAELAIAAAPIAVGVTAAIVSLVGPVDGQTAGAEVLAGRLERVTEPAASPARGPGPADSPRPAVAPDVEASTVPSSVPEPVAPQVDAGPVDVYVGADGADQATERGSDMPLSSQVGPVVLAGDPARIVDDTVEIVIGPPQTVESTP